MWNLPGPVIEPMSSLWAGRFLTVGPRGMSGCLTLKKKNPCNCGKPDSYWHNIPRFLYSLPLGFLRVSFLLHYVWTPTWSLVPNCLNVNNHSHISFASRCSSPRLSLISRSSPKPSAASPTFSDYGRDSPERAAISPFPPLRWTKVHATPSRWGAHVSSLSIWTGPMSCFD